MGEIDLNNVTFDEQQVVTRSMPGDRSGNMTDRQNQILKKKEERAAKRKAEEDLKLRQQQQWAMEKLKNSNVTFEQMAGVVGELDTKIMRIHIKIEASIHAMKRLDPNFSSTFEDSFNRIVQWRELVSDLSDLKISLLEIIDSVTKWNSDPTNPPISAKHLDESKITFLIQNDVEVSREDKKKFLTDMGVANTSIVNLLGLDPSEDLP